jgi:serine/threonine protein phosphatase PrpC
VIILAAGIAGYAAVRLNRAELIDFEVPRIAATLKHHDCSAQECVDTLIAAALDGGGSDNVTAILVRCH